MEEIRVRACLDTDVLVKCLRGIPSALDWLNSHPAEDMFVPGIAAMELAAGCRNKIELKQVQRLLKDFEVVWPDAQDSQRMCGRPGHGSAVSLQCKPCA